MINKRKCIVLYSGGLDSLLAAKILMKQGIDVIGFHCILPFISPDFDLNELDSVKIAKQNQIKLVYYRCDKEYLDLVKNPPHGYGKHINPCIDCKIFFIKKAAALMDELDAQFIASGEVVGQRPMSQMKHTLNHIINETNLKGKLLRPLSAKLLKPTIVEENGIVDRELLYDINGRSRNKQMELAKEFGIKDFSSPAGGCLFTDKNISKIIKDLFNHHDDNKPEDIYLLTRGRNFRINNTVKIIVSRNESENKELEDNIKMSDYMFIPQFSGPNVSIKGNLENTDYDLISSIISRYSKSIAGTDNISIYKNGSFIENITCSEPISDDKLKEMRI